MKAVRLLGMGSVLALVATLQPLKAQSVSIKAEMLKDWSDLKSTLDKIAAEMPDDKYTFKPTPPQQSFGERVVHIATVNVGILGSLGGKAAKPMIDPKVTTTAAASKAMDDSFDSGTALLNAQPDQTRTTAGRGPPRVVPARGLRQGAGAHPPRGLGGRTGGRRDCRCSGYGEGAGLGCRALLHEDPLGANAAPDRLGSRLTS